MMCSRRQRLGIVCLHVQRSKRLDDVGCQHLTPRGVLHDLAQALTVALLALSLEIGQAFQPIKVRDPFVYRATRVAVTPIR